MNKSAFSYFFSLAVCLIIFTTANAQVRDTNRSSKADNFVSRMQEFAKKEAHKSADEFASDKAAIAQNKIITEVKNTMQVAKRYLRSGIDTIGTKTQLQTIERDYNTAIDGVFVNGGTAQTFRNLTATSKILTELLNKAQGRKLRLDTHQQ